MQPFFLHHAHRRSLHKVTKRVYKIHIQALIIKPFKDWSCIYAGPNNAANCDSTHLGNIRAEPVLHSPRSWRAFELRFKVDPH